MSLPVRPELTIAVVPFVGSHQTEENQWFGALLARLLADHLIAAGLPVYGYDTVAAQIADSNLQVPLSEEGIQAIRRDLRLAYLAQGRFVVDDDSKMMGLRIIVENEAGARIPLEVSSPVARFPQFVEQVSLALIEQLGGKVTDEARRAINGVARPASFEAFRQLSMAIMSWHRGQNQLALASVTSALSLDPMLEEAAGIEAAIARDANDTATTREAFRRWSAIAGKRGRPLVAAERLQMLGHWLADHGEWSEAHKAYEDARAIYSAENNEYGKTQVANNLANLDMLSGKLQAAIQTYRRSLSVYKAMPQAELDLAATYFNLAVAHKSLGQADEAHKALDEALNMFRRLKDSSLEASCLALRGALHDDQGEWGRASNDYAQASNLFEIAGDDRHLALVRSHQGILKKQQGAFEQAESLMLEALRLFEEGGDPHEQAVIWFNLADLYYSMGLVDPALEYAQKAHKALSDLKSGWTSRARQLTQTLERFPRQPSTGSATASAGLLDFSIEPEGPDSETDAFIDESSAESASNLPLLSEDEPID